MRSKLAVSLSSTTTSWSIKRNFRSFRDPIMLYHHFNRTIFGFAQKEKGKDDTNKRYTYIYLLKEGNRNLQQGNALQAITDYKQAIDLEKTSEGYAKRAFAYLYIKDYDHALSDASMAIELNPRCIESYIAMGSIHVALNQHLKALEYLGTALDLISPLDFRRNSIEEVINGCKLALKVDIPVTDSSLSSSSSSSFSNTTNHQIPALQNFTSKLNSNSSGSINNERSTNIIPSITTNINDNNTNNNNNNTMDPNITMPFENKEFINLQHDITKQMVDIGGQEFNNKLMKFNQSPAIKKLGEKALRGEKPNYSDYMELMKDPKFQKYQQALTEITKQPKFAKISMKFAQMDWMGAYNELKKDPEALQLYMKAFDCFDDSPASASSDNSDSQK